MADMVLQTATAAVGAFGFGLLFRVSGGRLVTILLGGAANWVFYLLAMYVYADRVLAYFLAALATAALAEVLSRFMKTPVITLLVPMLIPLAPGGDLYHTTFALVRGDVTAFTQYGGLVLREAGAISFGIILVACVAQTAQKIWRLSKSSG
nr:threonine/serine exporter family protein [uncultured Agathobaculum sp.]